MTATPHDWTSLNADKVHDTYAPDEAVVGPAPQTTTQADRPRHAKVGPEILFTVTPDRISAYDYVLPTLIPGKGAAFNQPAIWWMGQLCLLVENHLLAVDTKASAEASRALEGAQPTCSTVPAKIDGRAVVCCSLHMIPIECVVRGYLAGSGLAGYRESGSVYGIKLSEGLTEASYLEEPILTPAVKAELGERDENITSEQAVERIGEELAVAIRDLSISLYRVARDIAAECGIITADTKFEFGIDVTMGAFVFADEILTSDPSRFWPVDQWVESQIAPSFDKQYLRGWLASEQSGWNRLLGANLPVLPESVAAATVARHVGAYRRPTGSDSILWTDLSIGQDARRDPYQRHKEERRGANHHGSDAEAGDPGSPG